MRDYIAAIIRDKAAEIRNQIKDGRLYGELIDMDNPDMVLVAAYLAGSMFGAEHKTTAEATHASNGKAQ